MKKVGLVAAMLLSAVSVQAQQTQNPPSEATQTAKPYVVVVREGSHWFRNTLLLGVSGAVISKERYDVVETTSNLFRVGEKMHGSELNARIGNSDVKLCVADNKKALPNVRKQCAESASSTGKEKTSAPHPNGN